MTKPTIPTTKSWNVLLFLKLITAQMANIKNKIGARLLAKKTHGTANKVEVQTKYLFFSL